jgi:RHS repeat-associated protein
MRSSIEISPKRYRYTGQERDNETGLYYYGARYFAPWLGRWMSVDPLALARGSSLSPYAYVRGRVTRANDPSGLDDDDVVTQNDEYGGTSAPGGAPPQQQPQEAAPTPDADATPTPAADAPPSDANPGNTDQASVPPPPAAANGNNAGSSGPEIIQTPQDEIDRAEDDKFWSLDLNPDKVTLPDVFAGFYGIAYGIKQDIYKPIRNLVSPEQRYYIDSSGDVKPLTIRQDHTDAIVAIAQIGALALPEARLAEEVPTLTVYFTDALAASPSDANFFRSNIEWAQSEGNLIRGQRLGGDAAFRRVARAELRKAGVDLDGLAAGHPLDSVAAGRFIQPGTKVGTTYYFGDASVNSSFGTQLGNGVNSLGLQLGDEFRVEFVGFPSYEDVPPIAPRASSPNLR